MQQFHRARGCAMPLLRRAEARVFGQIRAESSMAPNPNAIQVKLVRWSELHACIALAGSAAVLVGAPLSTLIVLAALSFAGFIWRCRDAWPRRGRLDAANALTTLRIVGVFALPAIAIVTSDLVVGALALALLALDGVDGWLARRLDVVSEFGEYLDKEADAFFMLVLCMLLYNEGRLGAWIVVPGLLRYGFVVLLMVARPREIKERRSARGRWIYFGMISALLAAFTPFPLLYRPCAAAMSCALIYSFAKSVFELYRPLRRSA
jgi:phosphatidylglycerophosphate synthase